MPKMSCPRFDGNNPCIWKAKCQDYFNLLDIPESMWTTAASLHLDGNAEKWMQVYKLKHGLGDWEHFMTAVQDKFGSYYYQHAINALLELRQPWTVEEYVGEFEALQYQISMYDQGMSDTYFIAQFLKGLKSDIRHAVQGQVPITMERAVMLAKIQQRIQEKSKAQMSKTFSTTRSNSAYTPRLEQSKTSPTPQLSKERQLRDYCRANNLCFYCKEPYDPTHPAKCTKRPKSQVNALAINNLDVVLTDEVLEQLEIEDTLTAEFGTLSLNAISGTEEGEAMRLRALVRNKVMLILVYSGSSHTFVSSAFLEKVGIQSVPSAPRVVKVANGDTLISDRVVPELAWWAHGHSFFTHMKVLDLGAYDCILGYD